MVAAICSVGVLGPSHGQECVFDLGYFSRSDYTGNKLVKDVVWLPERNEAKIITFNNDLISVKHWSCTTAGLWAVMLVHPDASTLQKTNEKLLELGRIVLKGVEHADFVEKISETVLQWDVVNEIDGPLNRPEFYYKARRFDGYSVIELKYYYN